MSVYGWLALKRVTVVGWPCCVGCADEGLKVGTNVEGLDGAGEGLAVWILAGVVIGDGILDGDEESLDVGIVDEDVTGAELVTIFGIEEDMIDGELDPVTFQLAPDVPDGLIIHPMLGPVAWS